MSIPIESKESLRQLFADLQAQRVRTMPPSELQINVNQRRLLEETADRDRFVKAGDVLEPFSLPEVDGGVFVDPRNDCLGLFGWGRAAGGSAGRKPGRPWSGRCG